MVRKVSGGQSLFRKIISLLAIMFIVASTISLNTSEARDESDPIKVQSIRTFDRNVKGGLYDGLITYEDVALIVNDNSEMSKEIGTYFAEKRGIPEINIINISVPEKEIITFSEYDELARQVKENLSDRDLTSSINYMVTTKGVPLKVTSGQYNMNYQSYYESASVDSELMLLDSSLESQTHRRWWTDNPYAGSGEPFSREDYGIRLVTRLTGYTKEEAMSLVDRAEGSMGNRGNAFLDMDPTKNGSSGYKQGNIWMADAHSWLIDNDYPSKLETTRDFETGRKDLMAYYSWGSNDGDWSEGQMSNGGFEYGTGSSASAWTYESEGGIVERTTNSSRSGSWSLRLTRNGTGALRAYQDIPINYPDHRYLPDARMSLDGVASPGARIVLEGYDASSSMVWSHELANRSGSRGFDAYQDPIENNTNAVTIRFIVELLGEGTVYFDDINLRVIRPHNTWINGSIAETIVSTGGRSMTYGTWYGQSLVADIIRDGVTGLKGYTWEPFITAVSRAHILFPAYYLGFSLAESFWMGSPYVSWMGTVIGDPKVTPFINERPDMGPARETDPLYTWVDQEGTSWLTLVLENKGGRPVEEGVVKFYMEGRTLFHEETVSLEPGEIRYLNISSEDKMILGDHEFTIEMDPDDDVWEYDEGNNDLMENLTINSRPELDASISSDSVPRTESIQFFLNITDLDMDPSLEGLNMSIIGPGGASFLPQVVSSILVEDSLEAVFEFTPAWNLTLGFYSLEILYTDPMGSFDGLEIYGAFKVVNSDPGISGMIISEDVPRGGMVVVELNWTDPDTPDGSLELTAYAEDASGSELDPSSITENGTSGATLVFDIPAVNLAQTWVFHAMVEDRDGGFSTWSSFLRTYNRMPNVTVLNGTGARITRLESVTFTILYEDPEGQPTDNIKIMVKGPVGDPAAFMVHDEEYGLGSGEIMELTISGFSLPLGNYSLEIDYSDDQSLGGVLSINDAFEVYNLGPVYEGLSVKYPDGEGEPGGILTRGRSATINIAGYDPDSISDPMEIQGTIVHNDTGREFDLRFESRGSSIYNSRVSTNGDWDVGSYRLDFTLIDSDGSVMELSIYDILLIDADQPIFQAGSFKIDLDRTADAEVFLSMGIGSSMPSGVRLHLLDENGSLIEAVSLENNGDPLFWIGSFDLDEIPESINLEVIDDLGRISWANGTMEIDVETAPVDDGPDDDPPSDDASLLLILLVLVGLVALLLLVLIFVLILRPKQEASNMVPAPPMGVPLPSIPDGKGLPSVEVPSLPPTTGGEGQSINVVQPPLPPGKELLDGSSYHRPALDDMNIEGSEKKDEMPKNPAPSKATNTGSDVVPPDQNVRDTDRADIPGDTGQSEQESFKGPGNGP